MYNYIQDLKLRILNEAERGKSEAIEGKSIDRDKIEATTDYDTPHRIMIGNELNDKSEARKLKNEIAQLREFMLTVVTEKPLPDQLKESISKSLDTDPPLPVKGKKNDPETQTWEYHKFGHSPLMGFLAIMSSLQIDLRNAESEMINYLYAQISAGEVKFNELEAVVMPNSNYIIKGNPYKATIFLAARDTTQAPDIYIVEGVSQPWVESTDPVTGQKKYERKEGLNYTKLPVEKGTGKGLFERSGSSVGTRTWGGIIEIKGPGGEPIIRPFSAEYMVAEGGAVVSPTKMNVFYLAVDNPVEISVSGVAGNKIRATASNGTLEQRGSFMDHAAEKNRKLYGYCFRRTRWQMDHRRNQGISGENRSRPDCHGEQPKRRWNCQECTDGTKRCGSYHASRFRFRPEIYGDRIYRDGCCSGICAGKESKRQPL